MRTQQRITKRDGAARLPLPNLSSGGHKLARARDAVLVVQGRSTPSIARLARVFDKSDYPNTAPSLSAEAVSIIPNTRLWYLPRKGDV